MPLTFQPASSAFVTATSIAATRDLPREPGEEHVRRVVGAQAPLERIAGFCTVPLIPSAPWALSAPLLLSFE